MSFDHRTDDERSPYARHLDDLSLDAHEEDAVSEFEQRLEQARYRKREAASSASEHGPSGSAWDGGPDDAA